MRTSAKNLVSSNSWFIHNPPARDEDKQSHPATFSLPLARSFIESYSKPFQLIVDPFLGTGTTLLAALEVNRQCIGIELYEKWAKIAQDQYLHSPLRKQSNIESFFKVKQISALHEIIIENAQNISKIWKARDFPLADYCFTSPPYWNQLKQDHLRQKKRKIRSTATDYGVNARDLGCIKDYNAFLAVQTEIFEGVYDILKPSAFLTIITNNVMFKGKNYPLAFDTVSSLSKKWHFLNEQILCQDNKALLPLGLNHKWIANRHHQYCLHFQK